MNDTEIIESIRTKITEKQQARAILVEQLRDLDDDLKALQKAEAVLNPQSAARSSETTETALRRIMEEKGAATLMVLTSLSGRQKNAVRTAVGKLLDQGFIERTGELVSRSPEYRIVASEEVAA